MALQEPPKFLEHGGIIPEGASHRNGGIALIDITGKKVGEIEGGEPILSKETYKNNKQLIDELLYSSQRLDGAKIGINSHAAISADRMFRNGGIIPNNTQITNHSVTNQGSDLSALVNILLNIQASIKEEKNRPIIFNYRILEEYKNKIEAIRVEVAA